MAISGADKAERIRKAHEAPDKVGLKGLYGKSPISFRADNARESP